jgi:hypothetical protein
MKRTNANTEPEVESAPRKGNFIRTLLDPLFHRPPRYSEQDRIVLARRGAWVGETAWFVPGMASNPVSMLPDDFPVSDLKAQEVRAALELKLISRAAITHDAWDKAQAVSEADVPDAALRLLRNLELHSRRAEDPKKWPDSGDGRDHPVARLRTSVAGRH